MLVRSAFAHDGPARRAVHALKYQGIGQIAAAVAPTLAALLPSHTTHLLPIPRALSRRLQYGVDTAHLLAQQLARITGTPVLRALRAPMMHTSQVRRRRSPEVHRFHAVGVVSPGAVLVDDVVTTGATLAAAARACDGTISHAITMTRAL